MKNYYCLTGKTNRFLKIFSICPYIWPVTNKPRQVYISAIKSHPWNKYIYIRISLFRGLTVLLKSISFIFLIITNPKCSRPCDRACLTITSDVLTTIVINSTDIAFTLINKKKNPCWGDHKLSPVLRPNYHWNPLLLYFNFPQNASLSPLRSSLF